MLRLRVSYQAVLQLLSPLGSGDTLSSPGPSAPWVLTATAGLQDLTTSSASQTLPGASSRPLSSPGLVFTARPPRRGVPGVRAAGAAACQPGLPGRWVFMADSAVSPESFFRNSPEQRGATSPWSRVLTGA